MPSTHEIRAAKMYGAKLPAKPAAPAAPARKTIYGEVHGQPLMSYYARRNAKLIHANDMETLAKSRKEEAALSAFLARKKFSMQDARTVLTALHEYEAQPRTDATKQQRAETAFEKLRLKHGSEDAAKAVVSRFKAFNAELLAEAPDLLARAEIAGANLDPDVIDVLARYSEPMPTT